MRKYWHTAPKAGATEEAAGHKAGCRDYRESAIDTIRVIVSAYRQMGDKTVTALHLMAPDMQLQPRRVRRLFERDRDPCVNADEYERILLGAARVLRRLADAMRDRVERLEAQADLVNLKHRQLTLWGAEEKECHGGKDSRPDRAA